MLEALNTVAWASLPQPEGNRPDAVPRALLELASAVSEVEATQAYHRFLFAVGNNHAGTYYQVVLATVPFLGQLLASGGDATRRASLEALIDLTDCFVPAPGQETVDGEAGSPRDLKVLLAEQVRLLLPTIRALHEDARCGDLIRWLALELCESLGERTRFHVPEGLVERLREHWGRALDDIEREHDAVILDGGLGPALYLTREGRILLDGTGWDELGVREASRAESFMALIVGARKTKLPELLDLLPSRPSSAHDCHDCAGTGRLSLGDDHRFVCGTCGGVGWLGP
jgi:hypothetical protein